MGQYEDYTSLFDVYYVAIRGEVVDTILYHRFGGLSIFT